MIIIKTIISIITIIFFLPFIIFGIYDFAKTSDFLDLFTIFLFSVPLYFSLHFIIKGRKKQENNFSEKHIKDNKKEINNECKQETKDEKNEIIPQTEIKEEKSEIIFQPEIKSLFADCTYDPLILDSAKYIIERERASIGMLQRFFRIGFNRAARIMDQLYDLGIVGEETENHCRKILISIDELEKIKENFNKQSIVESPVSESQQSSAYDSMYERIKMYNNKFDYMNGHDFEYFCAELLKKNRYENIEVTKGSGDQGIDIIAYKDGIKYGIQCKCYTNDIGNKAIQEAYSGKTFYGCHVAAVLTNRYFTASAKELSNKNGVLLWDRDYLNKLVKSDAEEINKEEIKKEEIAQKYKQLITDIGNTLVETFSEILYVNVKLLNAKDVENGLEFLMEGENQEQIDYLFSNKEELDENLPYTFHFRKLYENKFVLRIIDNEKNPIRSI